MEVHHQAHKAKQGIASLILEKWDILQATRFIKKDTADLVDRIP